MRFLRKDKTELPGFDHNAYGEIANVDHRTVENLLEEYQLVRMTSHLFFKNLSEEEFLRSGVANGAQISILAIAYIVVGHPLHHYNIIEEKYLDL
jgi:hypothetical protein